MKQRGLRISPKVTSRWGRVGTRAGYRVCAPNIQLLRRVNDLPLTAAYQAVVNVQLPGTGGPARWLSYGHAHGCDDSDRSATQSDFPNAQTACLWVSEQTNPHLSRNGKRKIYATLRPRLSTSLSYRSGEPRKEPKGPD